MRVMKIVLKLLAVLAILMGLLWIGQGTGLILWPASSFMLAQRVWAVWGALLAVLGVVTLVVASRR